MTLENQVRQAKLELPPSLSHMEHEASTTEDPALRAEISRDVHGAVSYM